MASEEFVKFLDKLAEKLGVTVEYMYKVYLEAQYYEAVVSLIQVVMLLVPLVSWIVYCLKKYKSHDWDGETTLVTAFLVGIAIYLIWLAVALATWDMLMRTWVPEYTAMKSMLRDIAGAVHP